MTSTYFTFLPLIIRFLWLKTEQLEAGAKNSVCQNPRPVPLGPGGAPRITPASAGNLVVIIPALFSSGSTCSRYAATSRNLPVWTSNTNPLTGMCFGIQGCDFTFWTCSRVFSSRSVNE